MKLLHKIAVTTALLTSSLFVVGSASPVSAALFDSARGEACKGANLDDKNNKCEGGASSLESTIQTVITILTTIVGVAAVIIIIINGLRFITANGDSNSITAARNGIIYALIGLVIAVMAQIIVRFVLGRI